MRDMDKRETWVDVVKGIAIYMVVFGHCIQYATPIDYDYEGSILFRLIYGFHMPLFMLISGYLFWISLQKYTFKSGIIAKVKGIMVPCLSWGNGYIFV
jgi:fucose 4-O-acetylase-like acetyltransferase